MELLLLISAIIYWVLSFSILNMKNDISWLKVNFNFQPNFLFYQSPNIHSFIEHSLWDGRMNYIKTPYIWGYCARLFRCILARINEDSSTRKSSFIICDKQWFGQLNLRTYILHSCLWRQSWTIKSIRNNQPRML